MTHEIVACENTFELIIYFLMFLLITFTEELTRAKTIETMRKQIGKALQIKLEQRGIPQVQYGLTSLTVRHMIRIMKQLKAFRSCIDKVCVEL